MTMTELNQNDSAKIVGYADGQVALRAKLLALGLTRGTTVTVTHVAPLGDPFEVLVRGYHLSLRRAEAAALLVKAL